MINAGDKREGARTAYNADRAAALAGVPRRTLHYWGRTGLLTPSVSPERVKLWSLEDVMGLRIIDWLRREKKLPDGRMIPRTSMPKIRRALERLSALDLGVWEKQGSTVVVDTAGEVLLRPRADVETVGGQGVMPEALDVLAPFERGGELRGPDLRMPRPHLRIVPGKLAGAPHVVHSRVETQSVAALAARGYEPGEIREMYPFLDLDGIVEAVELEQQLAQNLRHAA